MRTKYILTLETYPPFTYELVAAYVKTFKYGLHLGVWRATAIARVEAVTEPCDIVALLNILEDRDTMDFIFNETSALLHSVFVHGKRNRFLAHCRWRVGQTKPIIYVEHVLDG